jgi:hypothetical protein
VLNEAKATRGESVTKKATNCVCPFLGSANFFGTAGNNIDVLLAGLKEWKSAVDLATWIWMRAPRAATASERVKTIALLPVISPRSLLVICPLVEVVYE